VSSLPSDEPPRLRARERGRARRRLRFLRQARELELRDAGGFVFELYRFGEQRDGLVREKLDALIATDKEIRALETLLGVAGQGREIRQPGVGGACASCGAFHATDSRFCSACGAPLAAPAQPEAAAQEPSLAEEPPLEPQPLAEEPPLEPQPLAEEPPLEPQPAPPEPAGEVTVVRQEAGRNGAGPAEAEANGQLPAEPVPAEPVPSADPES
jgi:hypothetical protein